MALSLDQTRTLKKAFASRKPAPGGEAERQWRDDPGANWAPPKPRVRAAPIPNATKRQSKVKPIPSSRGQAPAGTQTFKSRMSV